MTALEEFKSQKEELLFKLDSLEKEIEFLKQDHTDKINAIEKKVIMDKDRYKLISMLAQTDFYRKFY